MVKCTPICNIQLTAKACASPLTKLQFLKRIQQKQLTRDENPHTHFCVYFAAYDSQDKKICIDHAYKITTDPATITAFNYIQQK